MNTESIAPAGVTPSPPGLLREFWGYFSANRGAVAGMVIVIAVLLMAAFAELLAPYPPNLTNNAAFLPEGVDQPPRRSHGPGLGLRAGAEAPPGLRPGGQRRAPEHAALVAALG